jgi:hypothetical protein
MPFIILTVGSALVAFLPDGRKARLAQLLHLPLLSITAQIHFAALALVPLSLYLILQARQRLTRYFWLSLLLAALTTAPYAVGALEAIQSGTWAGIQLSGAPSAAGDALLSAKTLEYALIVLSGADLHSLAGAQMFQRWLETLPAWAYSVLFSFGAISLACGIWRLWRGVRHRQALDVALGVWLLAPLAIFSARWVTPQLHYLIPIMPAAFLALGATLHDLMKRTRLATVLIVPIIGVALLQAALIVHLLSFLSRVATPDGFGTPLGMYLPVRAELLKRQPADLLIRVDGQFIGIDDEATIWDALLYDLPERRFLPPDLDVFPAQDALVLSMNCSADADGERYVMRPLPDGTPERCFTLSARRATDFERAQYIELPDRAALRIGGGLRAFSWDAQRRCLRLVWHLSAPAETPFGDQFHVALSLYAADQTRLIQADGQFWLGRFWRAGDRVVSRHCLPALSAEPAYAQIGLYTYRQSAEGLQFFNLQWLENGSELPFYKLMLHSAPNK